MRVGAWRVLGMALRRFSPCLTLSSSSCHMAKCRCCAMKASTGHMSQKGALRVRASYLST